MSLCSCFFTAHHHMKLFNNSQTSKDVFGRMFKEKCLPQRLNLDSGRITCFLYRSGSCVVFQTWGRLDMAQLLPGSTPEIPFFCLARLFSYKKRKTKGCRGQGRTFYLWCESLFNKLREAVPPCPLTSAGTRLIYVSVILPVKLRHAIWNTSLVGPEARTLLG